MTETRVLNRNDAIRPRKKDMKPSLRLFLYQHPVVAMELDFYNFVVQRFNIQLSALWKRRPLLFKKFHQTAPDGAAKNNVTNPKST